MNQRKLFLAVDREGIGIVLEAIGDGPATPVEDTRALSRDLPLDGDLTEGAYLTSPPRSAVWWARTPRVEDGLVVGTLDLVAAVQAQDGPVWRPQYEVVIDGTVEEATISVDNDLMMVGTISDGQITFDEGSGEPQEEAIYLFFKDPAEVLRVMAALRLAEGN